MPLLDIIERDLENATDLDSAIAIGQDAAADEERGRWRLAAIADQLDRAYGKSIIADFARSVNRKRSYVYEAAQTLSFYGLGNVIELVGDTRVITFSHMRDAMRAFRKLHPENLDTARDEAVHWLDVVAADMMTVEQAAVELKKRLGAPEPVILRFTATVRSVGEHHVLLAVPDGYQFSEGAVYRMTARLSTSADDKESS